VAASPNYLLGVGFSPSQSPVGTKTVVTLLITGAWVTMSTSDDSCGVLVQYELEGAGPAGSTVAVSIANPKGANFSSSVLLAEKGAVYLHNVRPSQVTVARASGTGFPVVNMFIYK